MKKQEKGVIIVNVVGGGQSLLSRVMKGSLFEAEYLSWNLDEKGWASEASAGRAFQEEGTAIAKTKVGIGLAESGVGWAQLVERRTWTARASPDNIVDC